MVWTFIIEGLLLNVIVASAYAQPVKPDSPPPALQRVCSQCHSLEIMGKCLAGDCSQSFTIHTTQSLPWDKVLDRMKGRGANFVAGDRLEILAYLNETYPPKRYPLDWERVGDFAGQKGWNVTTLREYKDFLYAGFEGSGKIFRTGNGISWQEVANTRHDTAYSITPFKGKLYAGTAEPDPQIWRSNDGLIWQPSAALPTADLGVYCVGVFKNKLYAGTGRSWIYRSSDGKKWEQVAALKGDVQTVFSNWMRFLIPFKGMLYAGIEQGALYRSADGITWVQANLNIGDNIGLRGATVFNGALYVGTTSGGVIWKSNDGQTWHRVFESPYNTPSYVASMAVAGKYLFASVGGYVFRTPDGLAWEEVGHLTPHTLEAMTAWRGNIYVGASTTPAGFIYRADPSKK